ncbi:unnamed protein product [Timema podura]|uniref:Uncharacterized protein n=1 Tax=Timema podura TaxID=61482 RepID=A0ABN7NSU0_TIMPD|nr:unnamed protein product [Timema podura]
MLTKLAAESVVGIDEYLLAEGKNKQYALTGYINYGEEDEMPSGGMDGGVTVHLEVSLKSTWAGGSAGKVLDCPFGLDVLDSRGHLTPIPA